MPAEPSGTGPGVITADGCAVDFYAILPVGEEPDLIAQAVPPPATVLELGAGAGRVTRELVARGDASTQSCCAPIWSMPSMTPSARPWSRPLPDTSRPMVASSSSATRRRGSTPSQQARLSATASLIHSTGCRGLGQDC